MPVAACPRAETLAAFARGDLSSSELAGVAEHVGGCDACCAALQLVPEGSLAGLARDAAAVPSNTVHSASPPTLGGPGLAPGGVPAGFADHSRYRILGEIGAGGMGTVYKAEDLLMGRVVALKVVSAHLTAKSSAVERFKREIKAAAQLKDNRIVTAYDAGEAGGSHFLVMEFLEGVSLDRLVSKKGPLSVSMACSFTRQAAQGLQHAADKGMVHRDIKPQNLMVTRKGQVKILDFGLARFAHDAADAAPARLPFGAGKVTAGVCVTNPNMLMGTPDYLSPEQAKNSHDVDHRSDIYSLGCTLYFLLAGKAPFLGAATLIDKLLAHTNDEPAAVRDARPEVPAGLADVLAKMMAKKPEDRYQTAAEVASALLPFTRSDSAREPDFEIVEAVVITPAPPTSRQFDTSPVPGTPTLTDAPRPKKAKKKKKASWWKRRKGAVIGGALAAALLIVAAVLAPRAKKLFERPTAPTNVAKVEPQNSPPQGKANQPDKTDKGEKGNTEEKGDKSAPVVAPPVAPVAVPPTVIAAPAKRPLILYVVPSSGVWADDYSSVRGRFKARDADVVTASLDGGQASSVRPSGPPGSPLVPGAPITIDMKLETVNLADYSAVVFCGEDVREYLPTGRGSLATCNVLKQMANKPIAAIGVGQGVLAEHGVLKDKKAAGGMHLYRYFPKLQQDKTINWDKRGWDKRPFGKDKPDAVVDGKIVTVNGAHDADELVEAVLKLVDGK